MMLLIIGRKLMGVVFAGDEIDVFGIIRIQGRLQGSASRIGNRADGQPLDFICVIGRSCGQMFSG